MAKPCFVSALNWVHAGTSLPSFLPWIYSMCLRMWLTLSRQAVCLELKWIQQVVYIFMCRLSAYSLISLWKPHGWTYFLPFPLPPFIAQDFHAFKMWHMENEQQAFNVSNAAALEKAQEVHEAAEVSNSQRLLHWPGGLDMIYNTTSIRG